MIVVDTSVWIDHLRAGDGRLTALLNAGRVLAHPFVIGELACGNLRQGSDVLNSLSRLPQAPVASQQEVIFFIESKAINGRGIGFVDAHLLASAAIATSYLWTSDKRLRKVAADLDLAPVE